MWKQDPTGNYLRDSEDPRVFKRVAADHPCDPSERWRRLGQEGIDNDGDGRTNEDGPGGDDMNRNWPGDWQPTYVQRGAGPYPFSAPETRCIGEWFLAHPNIAAAQSYHNTGGMILRGPGTSYMTDRYDSADLRVYDAIGRVGSDGST